MDTAYWEREEKMRLIDADKMCEDLATIDPQYETMIDWCIRVVNAQPTVDAEPIRHGHWVDVGSEVARVCSCCHEDVLYAVMYNLKGKEISLKYCPNCGAKMEK